jgi:serine/threonine-protein kinase ULK/ATG1
VEEIDLRLADFGFAIHDQQILSHARCGTPAFMAPEIIKGWEYGTKADIFSIGSIIYFIYTKKPLIKCESA